MISVPLKERILYHICIANITYGNAVYPTKECFRTICDTIDNLPVSRYD